MTGSRPLMIPDTVNETGIPLLGVRRPTVGDGPTPGVTLGLVTLISEWAQACYG